MPLNVQKSFRAHTGLSEQILEEFLVVDPCHATDFGHLGLSSRVPVDKVGRDANRQLAP